MQMLIQVAHGGFTKFSKLGHCRHNERRSQYRDGGIDIL